MLLSLHAGGRGMLIARTLHTVFFVSVALWIGLGLFTAQAQQADELESLNRQVVRLYQAGKYAEATDIAKRALAIAEKTLGPDHPTVGSTLNNLAALYREQGSYGEAEPLMKRALAIDEKALGPDHPDVGRDLSNLAGLYDAQGRYGETEPLFKRALAI